MALEHLAGDLGVDRIGIIEEGGSDEGETRIEEKPHGKEDDAVASRLDMSLWGRGGHVNSV